MVVRARVATGRPLYSVVVRFTYRICRGGLWPSVYFTGMVTMEKYLEAGKIVNTHGLRGEVKIQPWCDNAAFLLQFKELFIDGMEYTVEFSRVHKETLLAKLKGIDDFNSAERLKNKVVSISRDEVSLPEDRYFVDDLVGLAVFEQDGKQLGTLFEVLTTPAHDVYVVHSLDGEHMIPAVGQFVKEIDIENGRIIVELIEGM